VNYILLDEASTAVPGVQGSLVDILNLDPDHEATNITFFDNDSDERLSRGDVFWIKHLDHGGQAGERYSLMAKFDPAGDRMNGRGTILG